METTRVYISVPKATPPPPNPPSRQFLPSDAKTRWLEQELQIAINHSLAFSLFLLLWVQSTRETKHAVPILCYTVRQNGSATVQVVPAVWGIQVSWDASLFTARVGTADWWVLVPSRSPEQLDHALSRSAETSHPRRPESSQTFSQCAILACGAMYSDRLIRGTVAISPQTCSCRATDTN
jgi:hypothetical protein